MAEPGASRQLSDQFSDWRWRLNNLYWITDKKGHRTLFEMNAAQAALFDNMHFMNVILKARQLGFTTFIQLFMLDAAVFNSNIRAGTIAHTLLDAQAIFRDKVKFPYENLPDQIRAKVPPVGDSASELSLANNSMLRVSTSHRSGTLHYLHVSELGKLAAKYPEKAREVRTGALNTVQSGQIVFIESTAEGQEGDFYEICQLAQSKERAKMPLTPLDFRFHFFPWFQDPAYVLDPKGVTIPDDLKRYFDKLKTFGIKLSADQKAWYVKKAETQFDDMRREYPSTPEEAFEASVEGAYYATQLEAAERQGRIGEFPAIRGVPVNTAWDIGIGDSTCIWFFQKLAKRTRLVGYLEQSGEGLPYYVGELKRLAAENSWTYGEHFWPHDGAVDEWGSGKSREEQAREAKLKPRIVPRMDIDDGINAVRATLPTCEFDAGPCAVGLKSLKSYRKEWDDARSTWRDKPLHNWASHGADAFRTMASRYREIERQAEKPKTPDQLIYQALPDGRVVANMSVKDIIAAKMKRKERDD